MSNCHFFKTLLIILIFNTTWEQDMDLDIKCPCDYSCQNTTDQMNNSSNRWKCASAPTENGPRWLYMVSSCPSHWSNSPVSLQCSKSVQLSNYRYILDVPILSEESNILYSNIFCAACHNDSRAISAIPMGFRCSPPTDDCNSLIQVAEYNPGELTWTTVNVTLKATINGFPLTKLCQNYIDTCNIDNESISQYRSYSCSKYRDPHSSIDYFLEGQDVQCSVCNYIETNTTRCFQASPKRRSRVTPSFALILDFRGEGNVGKVSHCTKGQMYDTVQGSCISYFCGKGYEMDEDGRCVPGNLSLSTDPCLKILILESQYVYINASMIRVNRSDTDIFQTDSFELFQNGSLLVCAPQTVVSFGDKFSVSQGLLSSTCLILSLVCLTVHIIVHASIPRLRNLPGKNLLSLSCSIFVAQLLFAFAVDIQEPHILCVGVGATIHFCYLASFFWMNVMAYDMSRTFTAKSAFRNSPGKQWRTFLHYSTYSWIIPSIIVSISLILNSTDSIPGLNPRYGQPYCWFNSRASLAVFLALPLLVLLVENIIFFTLTAWAIRKAMADAAFAVKSKKTKERARFFLYLKLAFIVGLTWIFGFIAVLTEFEPLWYLFIILNSLQGSFIFFAFTFKRNVLSMLLAKLPMKLRPHSLTDQETTLMTSIQTTTTENLQN